MSVQGWLLGVTAVDTDGGAVCPVRLNDISNGGLVILTDQRGLASICQGARQVHWRVGQECQEVTLQLKVLAKHKSAFERHVDLPTSFK